MDPIFRRLPARAGDGLVNVVIDTPKGGRNKYKFEEEDAVVRLSRIVPAPWIAEIEHFVRAYNEAHGRQDQTLGLGGPKRALASLKEAERRFRKQQQ